MVTNKVVRSLIGISVCISRCVRCECVWSVTFLHCIKSFLLVLMCRSLIPLSFPSQFTRGVNLRSKVFSILVMIFPSWWMTCNKVVSSFNLGSHIMRDAFQTTDKGRLNAYVLIPTDCIAIHIGMYQSAFHLHSLHH